MLGFEYKTEWDLSKEFYSDLSDPEFERDLEAILPQVKEYADKYRGRIDHFTPQDFLEFFEHENKLDKLINKVAIYLFFLNSLDSQNQDVIKKQGQFDTIMTEVSNLVLFVSIELKELGFERLTELSRLPELAEYKNYFIQTARSIEYLLDEKTEFALNLKQTSGSGAVHSLYDEYTGSLTFEMEVDGKVEVVTEDEVRSARMSTKEATRKAAFESLRAVYNQKQNQILLSNIYRSVLKDWSSEIQLRKYKHVLSPRAISEQLDEEVIELLMHEVKAAYPLFQRYIKTKAKLMGKEKLPGWDVFAPLSKVETEIPFAKGVEMLLECAQEFDSEFYEYLKDMLSQGRVDVFPKFKKRGGAYCAYEAGFESYILMNYANKLDSVSTLIHESGHAFHGHLRQAQKPQVQSEPMCLAETASVFSETLLSRKIMQTLQDEEKLGFLENYLQDIFSTIFRQIQYVWFEHRCHEATLNGEELSYLDFNRIWREEQISMFGDTIEFDVPMEQESSWSSIPHLFRTPFYCFSYAFGNLLAFSLYQRYQENKQDFIIAYKNILKSGGSKAPYELLLENGFDISSKEFYQNGLKVVEELVDKFERQAGVKI
jgi:oligoendopeptidase F